METLVPFIIAALLLWFGSFVKELYSEKSRVLKQREQAMSTYTAGMQAMVYWSWLMFVSTVRMNHALNSMDEALFKLRSPKVQVHSEEQLQFYLSKTEENFKVHQNDHQSCRNKYIEAKCSLLGALMEFDLFYHEYGAQEYVKLKDAIFETDFTPLSHSEIIQSGMTPESYIKDMRLKNPILPRAQELERLLINDRDRWRDWWKC